MKKLKKVIYTIDKSESSNLYLISRDGAVREVCDPTMLFSSMMYLQRKHLWDAELAQFQIRTLSMYNDIPDVL